MYKNEKTIHSTEICGGRKTNIYQSVLKRNEKNTFLPPKLVSQLWHWGECFLSTQNSLTSLYLLCCDPGAGSSSRTSTLRAGYCCPESISPPLLMIYTCLFPQSVFQHSLFLCPRFYGLVSSSLHVQSQNLLFVFITERHALVLPHTGIAGRVLLVRWLVGAGFWGSVVFDPGCFY